MQHFAIIVVGASEGGVDAIARLFSDVPREIPAALFVTLHVGPRRSILPEIISQFGFPARHAKQGQMISPGAVLVAPPDHHLLIHKGHVSLSRGPRENWARPAIDPMFRTAAFAYGPRVIGVVLSGQLNDGSAGLYTIKQRKGITIVQDPADAVCPAMPTAALTGVEVDYCLPVTEIAAALHQSAKDIVELGAEHLPHPSGGFADVK